jgi:hypothetical protein
MAWNPCPPSRGNRAHVPLESVPTIAWNTQSASEITHDATSSVPQPPPDRANRSSTPGLCAA